MPPRHEDMMNLFSFRMVLVLINTAIHQVLVSSLTCTPRKTDPSLQLISLEGIRLSAGGGEGGADFLMTNESMEVKLIRNGFS